MSVTSKKTIKKDTKKCLLIPYLTINYNEFSIFTITSNIFSSSSAFGVKS
jgi:hypothetical protein